MRRSLGWQDKDIVISYAGNMGKGHQLNAFLDFALEDQSSRRRWIFAGGGDQSRRVRNTIEAKGHARIEYHEWLPRDQVLGAPDLQLVSMKEGWQGVMVPSKFSDICAAGSPVLFLGPRQSEVFQWIRQLGAGWCVETGDKKGLKRIFDSMTAAEIRRRGNKARSLARQKFNKDSSLQKLMRVMQKATKDGA